MCNTCTNYTNGCYNYTQANTTGNNCGCGCNQRICRDCCGNIWVRQNVSRGNRCCSQGCGCNTCGTGGNTAENGGGGVNGVNYGCFTICGRIFNGAATQTATNTQNRANCADGYYARQYGYYPYGRSGCCCGSGLTNFVTTTTIDD